jgi:restriction endonuclease S subunit
MEAVFSEQLKEFFLSPEQIAAYLGHADDTIKEKEALLATLKKEERRVTRQMEKVYSLYLADEISTEGFGRQYRPLEERLGQLEEEVPRLEGELDFLRIEYFSSD